MLCSKISSDPAVLEVLSARRPWIPNAQTMRPTPEDLAKKMAWLAMPAMQPPSQLKQYLLDTLFKGDTWAFSPAMFRYNTTGEHYVLWNSEHDYYFDYDDDHIDSIITGLLTHIVGNTNFDYAWYKNPKPSVPELYHVHVFWVTIRE
jgi:hypothetical protein